MMKDWSEVAKEAWETRAQQLERERDDLQAKLNRICELLSADVPATRKERDAWWGAIEAWIKTVRP